jgi:hypothetical protein
MAKIVYCHPGQTKYSYHVYTDLDFWDTRRLIRNMAVVKRNFGSWPPGDDYPTQVVGVDLERKAIREIEKRLTRAIVSPPRHVIVRSMVFDGYFEFDPTGYYPHRWSKELVLHFTYKRLPLAQGALCNPYQTVELRWHDEKLRLERVQRPEKHDPIIRTKEDARRHAVVPSCF